MSVEWHRLGEYIEECDERNIANFYRDRDVRGISTGKELIATKANLEGVDLSSYKIVKPGMFAYVSDTSRRGEKISLSYNDGKDAVIVSSISTVFRVAEGKLDAGYLSMLFHRSEFDRYARFNSWGSARETFSFADMQRVEIPVPPLAEQKKAVEAWQGLRKMKEQNEQLAEPLLALCRSYLQECKRKYEYVELGPMIGEENVRNQDGRFTAESVRGISTGKEFIATAANLEGVKLDSYKVVGDGRFAYVSDTSRRGDKMSLGYNQSGESILVSSISTVFSADTTKLNATFLYLWFSRPEFDRYARFNSWGSARETFNWADMCRVKIPLPPLEVQQAIVDVYRCANEAKKIAAEADRLSREICPALIQHVVKDCA